MGTEMRLCESLMNSEVSSYQQGMLVSGDSCGFVDHVNEDDDKLKTCTIQEEDQRNLLMVGGIRIFLPGSPVEARICVADEGAIAREGQPDATIKGEVEKMLEAAQEEGNEHSKEIGALKFFSQAAETEMTAALELATEEEEKEDNTSFVDLYQEFEALERRVKVQSLHIQQVKLEVDEGGFQSEEQLERAGDTPAGEMA
jgi:hypothetical protein